MTSPEISQMDGVFIVFWYLNQLVLLSVPETDLVPEGKSERVLSESEDEVWRTEEMVVLSTAMFSVVSGGVDVHDISKINALQREVLEETGLNIETTRLLEIVGETRTLQDRNGEGLFIISGEGYEYKLTDDEYNNLKHFLIKNDRQHVLLKKEEVISWLEKTKQENIRPFLLSVIQLLQRNGVFEIEEAVAHA